MTQENGQGSLFPADTPPAEPVDTSEIAAHIAAHAPRVEYADRTSEAAQDQGHGPQQTAETPGAPPVETPPLKDPSDKSRFSTTAVDEESYDGFTPIIDGVDFSHLSDEERSQQLQSLRRIKDQHGGRTRRIGGAVVKFG